MVQYEETKFGRIRWMGYVACMGDGKFIQDFCRKPEVKRSLENLTIDGVTI
jgi:hypothetical protein